MIQTGPHVVILGAGATLAAIPNGDKNGKRCSTMDNFIENMHLRPILDNAGIKTDKTNLEEVFSEIDKLKNGGRIRTELEEAIVSEMNRFIIPDAPTAYDYLLLSLRDKDYVFSFNWDNLLIQSYLRLQSHFTSDLPQIYFLHGNISLGFCADCWIQCPITKNLCPKCGKKLIRPQILFPIVQKDYESDSYIAGSWDLLKEKLSEAKYLTIFGYSAPSTDTAAVKIMREAFSTTSKVLQSLDIIDVKDQSELYNTWSAFITEVHDHVNIYKDIKDSLIGQFPRRTIEGYEEKYIRPGRWSDSAIILKKTNTMSDLYTLIKPLLDNEDEGDYSVLWDNHPISIRVSSYSLPDWHTD